MLGLEFKNREEDMGRIKIKKDGIDGVIKLTDFKPPKEDPKNSDSSEELEIPTSVPVAIEEINKEKEKKR